MAFAARRHGSKSRMEPAGQFTGADAPPTLAELVVSLEHSALMAKQLLTATDPTHLQRIHNSLTTAHHHLSSFLSLPYRSPNFPPPDENSDSSAMDGNAEAMQVGEEEEMRNSESGPMMMMEKVEEKMRGFFISNKRATRSLSPSAAEEQKRLHQGGYVESSRFDPNGTRLRNLDLIYQFHS